LLVLAPEATKSRVIPGDGGARRWHDGRVKWTVLIVDDDDEFRSLACALLDRGPLRVVGEAANCREALARVAELGPAVVVIDIGLPDGDGFLLADRLAAGVRSPAVVLVSSRDERTYRDRLRDSPVRGFIAKDELSRERLEALLL
jgi:DNA-binding NarL/FixJ family response regulator